MNRGFLLIFIVLLFSCNEDIPKEETAFDKRYLYRAYFHVSRDIENEKEVYHYDYTPLNSQQRNALLVILKGHNLDYKICVDSTILVSTISVPHAYYMSTIDDELKERLGRKGYDWSK